MSQAVVQSVVQSASFVRDLARRLSGEVYDDDGTRAAYSFDASNHRVPPRAVVFPRTAADLVTTMTACRDAGVPVTARGGGTSLAGDAIGSGVVVDCSRYLNQVLRIDPEQRLAEVQPGLVLDDLQAAAGVHRLRFGPDPSTHGRCTMGGMIGTNACGSRAMGYGTTSANTLGVDLVLADGSTTSLRSPGEGAAVCDNAALQQALTGIRDRWSADIRRETGRFGRQVSGYGLQYLLAENGFDPAKAFVGSEGTCGLITSATVRLVEAPEVRHLVVVGYPDLAAAAAAAPVLARLPVLTVEGMDETLVASYDATAGPARRPELPEGKAWLMMEVGGAPQECAAAAEWVQRAARETDPLGTRVVTHTAEQAAFWRLRERGAGLSSRLPDGSEYWPGWEDAAVPVENLPGYLADLERLLADHGLHGISYGHFGEACVHTRVDFDMLTSAGRAAFARFQHEAAEVVVRHHGSLSGEHGDGRARSALLETMYSAPVIEAFGAFKAAFDPEGLLNPHVLVDPLPVDDALRHSLLRSHTRDLAFTYPQDDGDLGKATRRCIGVGACRSKTGGMCPSFQATDNELHSTRGRARLLQEMLDGDLADQGWQSDAVDEALDLCLMCKACKSECPVSVDMATYKAEFLHHRYRGRLRPLSHYSMGWLPAWLAAGRRMPRLANRVLSSPLLSRLAKRIGGIDPHRDLPSLAEQPVRRRRPRRRTPADSSSVVVWLDTFTTSFAPEVVDDALAVLAAAGLRAETAGAGGCCGLTWVSTGQLGVARRVMQHAVAALDRPGDTRPVVVLEPSCAAALRDDAVNLLGTERARRVAGRIRGLAEVLLDRDLPLRADASDLVVQFHCHQRATAGTDADLRVLKQLGATVTTVDEGCCGLAGNFGFEDGHYDVSKACAEKSFLPYLVGEPDAGVLADGFSCRLQMNQLGDQALAGRRPQHLATLLRTHLP